MSIQTAQNEAPQPSVLPVTIRPPLAKKRDAEFRYPLRWRVSLDLSGEATPCPGSTVSIAGEGCTVVLERNPTGWRKGKLHLRVPPTEAGSAPEVISITAVILQTHLSRQGYVAVLRYAESDAAGTSRLRQIINHRYR